MRYTSRKINPLKVPTLQSGQRLSVFDHFVWLAFKGLRNIIKTWTPNNSPCRLCKVYTEGVEFLSKQLTWEIKVNSYYQVYF